MKRINLTRFGLLASVAGIAAIPVSASALQAASTAPTSTSNSTRLSLIITRGNSEISRRLTTLNTLGSQISGAQKLSSTDKSSLGGEVTGEVNNLTSLKTKLDADTDVSTAASDAQSIITDYRVYALVYPKVELVRTADAQQVAESKLTTLAGKLQARVSGGSSNQQSELTDMHSKIAAAQLISVGIESKVVGLQPTDYNSDHSVLSGDRDQLKTAQTDVQAAITDAKDIIASLKS